MPKTSEDKFTDRVRFNWGYHDAHHACRMGWANAECNFGFGPDYQFAEPNDIAKHHRDPSYAAGWMFGYADAVNGRPQETSEEAWKAHTKEPAAKKVAYIFQAPRRYAESANWPTSNQHSPRSGRPAMGIAYGSLQAMRRPNLSKTPVSGTIQPEKAPEHQET